MAASIYFNRETWFAELLRGSLQLLTDGFRWPAFNLSHHAEGMSVALSQSMLFQ